VSETRPEIEQAAPILVGRQIVKNYPGVRALKRVDFEVFPGKVHGLIGENGAGKSTLMHILAGAQSLDEGEILLDGAPVEFADTRAALDRGVSIVYQELNLVPFLTVAENIFLGRELLTRIGLIDSVAQHRKATELLRPLDATIDPRAEVGLLRVGQQQIVEIAKALNADARVIFFDEPTSAISDQEVEVLFELIDSLRRKGIGIVYVSHKLDELFRICDSITVLRDGKLVETLATNETNRDAIVSRMVGRDLVEAFTTPEQDLGTVAQGNHDTSEPALLEVRNVSLPNPLGDRLLIDHVSFSLAAGEVLGIFGLMGAGRTELLETIYGLHAKTSSGEILVDGKLCTIRSPQDAIATGIGLVPEDRKQQGLVLMMSVEHNVSLASLDQAERALLLSRQRERQLVSQYVDRLEVKTPNLEQQVRNLSGGNQQKVVLAKVLATKPRVLMLDEPTRGIDVGAKVEIFHLIHELKQQGMGILMVSSELSELLTNADRILVMCEGLHRGVFQRWEATEEALMGAAVPGEHANA